MIAPAWVGDMVMAHSLFRLLAAADSELELELVAPPVTAPLGARMAEVKAVHVLDVAHGRVGLAKRRRLAAELRARGFEHAIVLPNSWKSALVPFLARIPHRTGWRGEMRYGLLNDPRVLDAQRIPRMVDRFAALGLAAGEEQLAGLKAPRPRLEADTGGAQRAREELGLVAHRPVLACCPGAEFGASKRWPTRHFSTLIDATVRAGWQVWLFGSAGDAAVTRRIRSSLAPGIDEAVFDLAGRTSLLAAVDLLSTVRAVVSNDSGLMHVAAALDLPVVALFGSTSTAFTPPLGSRVQTLTLGLDCSPCFRRTCPLRHHDCLERLHPERVTSALTGLMTARPGWQGMEPKG